MALIHFSTLVEGSNYVKVDEHIRSKLDIGAIVSVKWWLHPWFFVKHRFVFVFGDIFLPWWERCLIADNTDKDKLRQGISFVEGGLLHSLPP